MPEPHFVAHESDDLARTVEDWRARHTSLEAEPCVERHSILSGVVQAESAEALALAIDRLPILLREAFVLHLVEGVPYAEMVEITQASLSALQVRTHRAKSLLRRQLGKVVDTFWSESSQ